MEKYFEIWKPVLENFKNSYPELYDSMVDWYPSGYLEITVKLSGGQYIAYEFMGDLTRPIRSLEKPEDLNMDEEEWRLIFAERLKTRMYKCGINQDMLSHYTGISRVTLSNYVNSKATPSGFNLERLSRALNCSVAQLTSTR